MELYQEWGAEAKVKQLMRTRGIFIVTAPMPGQHRSSTASSMFRHVTGEDSEIHNYIDFTMMSGLKAADVSTLGDVVSTRDMASSVLGAKGVHSSQADLSSVIGR